ncbi:PREDICTED: proline and serine-rich protein 2 [Hipposideros armiger]|uniref:Proline and serine-rich protein 2 n=1 Tax=Hipposideros armiger TaxID=186990 RepID=A0A8B7SJ02_HIPAR|nr:PREDICTED: proline and serine-rich protein 2 [Hipposideros armiger]
MESRSRGCSSHLPPGRPEHCTSRACKPAPGRGPTPHPTSGVWPGHGLRAAPNTPGDSEPVDRSHHPHNTCSGLGEERARKPTRTPKAPAAEQGMLGEGKKPEIIPQLQNGPLAPSLLPVIKPLADVSVGMPINHQKSDSAEMDSDLSLSCRLSDLSRGGSLESRSSSSRSRSLTSDDESLKFLTHEEKDVILFFEETIDSLEDDLEEQVLCDSRVRCLSPRSLEGSASNHSEPEDVIDLVPPGRAAREPECLPDVTEAAGAKPVGEEDTPVPQCGTQDTEACPPPEGTVPVPEALPRPPSLPVTAAPAHPRKELLSPPPAEHPKLPRSVPTPLVIAQKMSEKLAGNEALSPTSPSKEGRPGEWRTLTSVGPGNGEHSLWPRHTAQPAPKTHRFPSNISVTNSAGREFNKTISKAAVNVQERKARVLANINGVSFFSMGESEDRAPKSDVPEPRRSASPEPGARDQSRPGSVQEAVSARAGGQPSTQQSRGVQTELSPPLANGFQSVHDVLKSERSAFVSTGKTITIRPDAAHASKLARQNASKSLYEHWQADCSQHARKRSGSLPRAVGFRPQGITVQFAGRGSTEEARREALRKLGLLKETL